MYIEENSSRAGGPYQCNDIETDEVTQMQERIDILGRNERRLQQLGGDQMTGDEQLLLALKIIIDDGLAESEPLRNVLERRVRKTG